MNKLIAKMVLPVFAFVVALGGVTPALAANVITGVTGSDDATLNGGNQLTISMNTAKALNAGDMITVSTRLSDGSGIALGTGAIVVNGQAETAVATASVNTVSITLANAVPAGAFSMGAVTGSGLAIVNPGTPENVTIAVTTTAGDVGAVTHAIASGDTVQVIATVEPTLSLSLSSLTLNLGAVNTAAIANASNTVTISTNAANGYILSAESGLNGTNKLSNWATQYDNLAAGTEGFGVRVNASPATILTGAGNIGAGLAGDSAIAPTTPQGLVQNNGPANIETTTIDYGVAIQGDTPAGTYTETVTYSVTGNF